MPKLYFAIFLVIAMSVLTAMHGFVYWRLACGLALTNGQRLALKLLLAAGALTFVAAEFLSRLTPLYPMLYAGSLWIGVMAIALTVFLLELFFSLLFPQQRRFIVMSALAVIFLISIISLVNVALGPVLRQIKVPIQSLPAGLEGFTIVQLSDLHLGNLASTKQLRLIVERVNALNPDLICLTGDVLDGEISHDGVYAEILGSLRARHGVAAVTGNHEFYAGIEKFLNLARQCRWRLLRNQSWIIDGRMAIIGLEEDTARRFKLPGPDLEAALRGVPDAMPKVLLYHQPQGFPEAARRGIDLQLSGHTHAGQVPPMDLLVWLIYKYPWGLYRLGQSHIYTTSGTGTWGPPMRFLSRSEIVKLVLVPEKPGSAPVKE